MVVVSGAKQLKYFLKLTKRLIPPTVQQRMMMWMMYVVCGVVDVFKSSNVDAGSVLH